MDAGGAHLACSTRPRPWSKSCVKLKQRTLDIKKQLHVNDALAKQYAQHLNQFEAKEPVPCAVLYDSPLYEACSFGTMDEEDAEWANSYVRIFSGLYGFLRPFDDIQTLSLPVGLNTKLTNSKGQYLRNYWREHIEKEMEDALRNLPMPVVVNMAEEDKDFFSDEFLPANTRVIKVDFKISNKEDAGAAKGEFLRWMLENRCMAVEELLEFKGLDEEAPDYRLSKKQPSSDTLLFEQNVGDGIDGGWSKKMKDYGGSKNKFIKEFASGAQKYQRTEIKNAMKKETKANKKKGSSAFY
eukprot:symbB.v1.2.025669.t1/scaffold2507.1/size77444/3